MGKAIHNLDHGINKIRNMSFSYTKPSETSSGASKKKVYHFEEDY